MDQKTWETLLDLLERELESATDSEHVGGLCCRLALLHWDVRGDQKAAEHWLARADQDLHLGVELRRQLLLDSGDGEAAASMLEELAVQLEDPELAGQMLEESAILWLIWAGDAARARKTCNRGGDRPPPDVALGELHELALAVGGEEQAVVDHAEEGEVSHAFLLLAGTLLLDRFDRPPAAEALLRKAFEADDEDPYILELLIEVSACLRDPERRVALITKKLELLSRQGGRNPEVLAMAFDLSRILGELGHVERAATLLERVDPTLEDLEATDPLHVNPLAWAGTLLRIVKRDQAVRQRDCPAIGTIYTAMAEVTTIPVMSRVYRLRAAQLTHLDATQVDQAEALLVQNLELNSADQHSAAALERLLLRRGKMEALCEHLEAQAKVYPDQKGPLLHKAALVAEAHLGNLSLAASLRRDSVAAARDPWGHGDLQRLYRAMHSEARLMEAYEREADTSDDPARRALLWGIIAVLRLKTDQPEEAETACREVLELAPKDPLALALQVSILRVQGRDDELRQQQLSLVDALSSPANRAELLRQVAASATGANEAKEHLRRALELNAGDPGVLEQLVDCCEAAEELEEAVNWGLELAQAVDHEPQRAAAAYIRVGRLYHERLGEVDHGAQALTKALQFDAESVEALTALAGIQKQTDELDALLETLKSLQILQPDEQSRAETQFDVASTLELLEADPDEVIESYAVVMRGEALRDKAVSALGRYCRKQGRVEDLVALLSKLPPEEEVLNRLAEGLEELGELERLTQVRAQLVELADGDLSRADRTYELGRVLEDHGRPEQAAVEYEQVLALLPKHQPALRALQRLYQADGRLPELATLLLQELEVVESDTRRFDLLLDLAGTHEACGEHEAAAQRLEQALELQPGNQEVLGSLERLYDPDQPLELARVLNLRAEIEVDESIRATLYLQAGELLASINEIERALPLLWRAIRCDPGNRQVFTLYEALAYEKEHWHQIMELYDQVISFVVEEDGRAYRPVDLYVRRGQLQLNHLGQPGEAVASLLQALEHDPKSESVMKLLETIFAQQQDWQGLIRTYEKRASLVPNNELFRLESLRQAARLATSRLPGSAPDSRKLWEEVHSIDPTDEEALDALERIYVDAELHDQLADLLETRQALTVNEDAAVVYRLRLAELCETKLEDPKRAAKAFAGVRQVHEHHEEALKSLARIYEATGEWERCIDVLKDLVIMEADPNERSLHYFRCGSIMESQFREDDQAIHYYEAAINESAGCLPAIHGLRDLYLRREEWNQALETLELEVRLWDEGKEQAGILARMGEIRLHHLKDVRKAVEEFEDAMAVDPDCQPAIAALFDVYFERGDNPKALELAEKMADRMLKEGDPEQRSQFFARRGQLLAVAGNISSAVESLVVALELTPENLEALDWLIALCRRSPDAYDFATIFRDLEQVYRREENQDAVGHVLVAAGALSEIAGDAETAVARYQEAMEVAPQDLAPVKSLANLLVRIRRIDEAVSVLTRLCHRAKDLPLKIRALIRLGELWSNVAMEPVRAAQTYQEVLSLDPSNPEASFRLAQELVTVGRNDEAYERMVELLDRVEGPPRPRILSNYTHYLGVVLLRLGDTEGALEQFRHALQLNGRNVNAAIALARELTLSGDREGAQQVLIKAIHKVSSQGGADVAIDLRRTLGSLHLGAGELLPAVSQFESVVRAGERVEDRITLAEVYAQQVDGLGRATDELWRVIENDSFNPHALRLLADLYERDEDQYRTLQVLQVMEMLGWASKEDRDQAGSLRRIYAYKPVCAMDDGLRQLMVYPTTDTHVQQLWDVIRDPLERLFPLELPQSPEPVAKLQSPDFRQLAERCVDFFSVDTAVLVADDVPGGAVADSKGKGRVILDRLFVDRPFAEVAFVLGRDIEYVRSGHALVSRLAFDDRQLLGELLSGLLQAPEEQNDLVQEFRKGLPRKLVRQIDSTTHAYQQHLDDGGSSCQTSRWFSGIDRSANQAGLVACDDISASLRTAAQLGGQELAVGPKGEVAVQLVTDGPDLVQFFLSDRYISLRRRLAKVE